MFTQRQLEQAYEQISAERLKEAYAASGIAKWIQEKIGLNVIHKIHSKYSDCSSAPKPHPVDYELVIPMAHDADINEVFKLLKKIKVEEFTKLKFGDYIASFNAIESCPNLCVKQQRYDIIISFYQAVERKW